MSLPAARPTAARLPDDPDALVALLLDPPFVQDPYPVASRLRELAPVHRTDRGFWLVSDAASVEQVYRGPTLRIGFDTARRGQDALTVLFLLVRAALRRGLHPQQLYCPASVVSADTARSRHCESVSQPRQQPRLARSPLFRRTCNPAVQRLEQARRAPRPPFEVAYGTGSMGG